MPRKQKKASERYEKAASFFPLCKMSLNENVKVGHNIWKTDFILKSYAADIMNSKS